MGKVGDIPQDVWDLADKAHSKAAFSSEPITAIARALMAAKAEEREACAELCGGLRHEDRSAESEDWVEGTFACQAAIRKRGEALDRALLPMETTHEQG